MRKLIIFSAITLIHFSPSSWADVTAEQCGFDSTGFLEKVDNAEESVIDVKADDVQLVNEGLSVFSGDVEVSRGGQELKSDRASYNRISGDVTAQGNVQIRDSDIILNAEQAEWSLTNGKGSMIEAQYRLREGHARGNARYAQRQGTSLTKLKDASYTTCAPGDNAWELKAAKVDLDHEKSEGVARDVVVRVADIPVFYTPYISFPLNDERKSGFLTPSVGASNDTGFDVRTPYYWNISPNKDATITPRYMAERGLMLNGEFRYLEQNHRGTIDAAFLASDGMKYRDNDDDILNPYRDEDRKHFSWRHNSRFTSGWNANIDYNYVSDKAYLEDFGSNLSLTSTTHINRDVNVNYSADNWSITGRLQGYQTVIEDVSKPYQRLPQLLFQSYLPDQALGLSYGMKAEYVDFDHASKVDGQRFNIEPSVSLPLRSTYGFITPRIALHHTQYDLEENDGSLTDSSPSRTVAISSIDSGLFFERELSFSDSSYLQTLEPRAFYLYIPEKNQSDIPLFDTGLRTFSMGQLFSYNRFSGADRIGDANQLTLALTSRIIDQETGREKLRATIGQIQYFDDREVSVNNATVLPDSATRSQSDYIAEVVASITQEWSARAKIQWDPSGDTNSLSAASLTYRGQKGALLNVSHRYRRDTKGSVDGLEQFDISTHIPLSNNWSIVGRWYYSIKDDRTLESLAGIEYDSCCWATRLVARDYINTVEDLDRNLGIFLEVELKGLGNFGKKTANLLEKSVLGYGS